MLHYLATVVDKGSFVRDFIASILSLYHVYIYIYISVIKGSNTQVLCFIIVTRRKIKKSIRVSVFIDQFPTCKGKTRRSNRYVRYIQVKKRKRRRIVIFQEAGSEVEEVFKEYY